MTDVASLGVRRGNASAEATGGVGGTATGLRVGAALGVTAPLG